MANNLALIKIGGDGSKLKVNGLQNNHLVGEMNEQDSQDVLVGLTLSLSENALEDLASGEEIKQISILNKLILAQCNGIDLSAHFDTLLKCCILPRKSRDVRIMVYDIVTNLITSEEQWSKIIPSILIDLAGTDVKSKVSALKVVQHLPFKLLGDIISSGVIIFHSGNDQGHYYGRPSNKANLSNHINPLFVSSANLHFASPFQSNNQGNQISSTSFLTNQKGSPGDTISGSNTVPSSKPPYNTQIEESMLHATYRETCLQMSFILMLFGPESNYNLESFYSDSWSFFLDCILYDPSKKVFKLALELLHIMLTELYHAEDYAKLPDLTSSYTNAVQLSQWKSNNHLHTSQMMDDMTIEQYIHLYSSLYNLHGVVQFDLHPFEVSPLDNSSSDYIRDHVNQPSIGSEDANTTSPPSCYIFGEKILANRFVSLGQDQIHHERLPSIRKKSHWLLSQLMLNANSFIKRIEILDSRSISMSFYPLAFLLIFTDKMNLFSQISRHQDIQPLATNNNAQMLPFRDMMQRKSNSNLIQKTSKKTSSKDEKQHAGACPLINPRQAQERQSHPLDEKDASHLSSSAMTNSTYPTDHIHLLTTYVIERLLLPHLTNAEKSIIYEAALAIIDLHRHTSYCNPAWHLRAMHALVGLLSCESLRSFVNPILKHIVDSLYLISSKVLVSFSLVLLQNIHQLNLDLDEYTPIFFKLAKLLISHDIQSPIPLLKTFTDPSNFKPASHFPPNTTSFLTPSTSLQPTDCSSDFKTSCFKGNSVESDFPVCQSEHPSSSIPAHTAITPSSINTATMKERHGVNLLGSGHGSRISSSTSSTFLILNLIRSPWILQQCMIGTNPFIIHFISILIKFVITLSRLQHSFLISEFNPSSMGSQCVTALGVDCISDHVPHSNIAEKSLGRSCSYKHIAEFKINPISACAKDFGYSNTAKVQKLPGQSLSEQGSIHASNHTNLPNKDMQLSYNLHAFIDMLFLLTMNLKCTLVWPSATGSFCSHLYIQLVDVFCSIIFKRKSGAWMVIQLMTQLIHLLKYIQDKRILFHLYFALIRNMPLDRHTELMDRLYQHIQTVVCSLYLGKSAETHFTSSRLPPHPTNPAQPTCLVSSENCTPFSLDDMNHGLIKTPESAIEEISISLSEAKHLLKTRKPHVPTSVQTFSKLHFEWHQLRTSSSHPSDGSNPKAMATRPEPWLILCGKDNSIIPLDLPILKLLLLVFHILEAYLLQLQTRKELSSILEIDSKYVNKSNRSELALATHSTYLLPALNHSNIRQYINCLEQYLLHLPDHPLSPFVCPSLTRYFHLIAPRMKPHCWHYYYNHESLVDMLTSKMTELTPHPDAVTTSSSHPLQQIYDSTNLPQECAICTNCDLSSYPLFLLELASCRPNSTSPGKKCIPNHLFLIEFTNCWMDEMATHLEKDAKSSCFNTSSLGTESSMTRLSQEVAKLADLQPILSFPHTDFASKEKKRLISSSTFAEPHPPTTHILWMKLVPFLKAKQPVLSEPALLLADPNPIFLDLTDPLYHPLPTANSNIDNECHVLKQLGTSSDSLLAQAYHTIQMDQHCLTFHLKLTNQTLFTIPLIHIYIDTIGHIEPYLPDVPCCLIISLLEANHSANIQKMFKLTAMHATALIVRAVVTIDQDTTIAANPQTTILSNMPLYNQSPKIQTSATELSSNPSTDELIFLPYCFDFHLTVSPLALSPSNFALLWGNSFNKIALRASLDKDRSPLELNRAILARGHYALVHQLALPKGFEFIYSGINWWRKTVLIKLHGLRCAKDKDFSIKINILTSCCSSFDNIIEYGFKWVSDLALHHEIEASS